MYISDAGDTLGKVVERAKKVKEDEVDWHCPLENTLSCHPQPIPQQLLSLQLLPPSPPLSLVVVAVVHLVHGCIIVL